ncbi:hypothetical protein Bca52824_027542 [Brassica carinata]|uniref:MATH domain-containing protein n=1 Tax=Brassica carinata TaxID=52824 RepID=A0A8X8ALA1_BRACI|nr:hypothetical protein Bca52824_027542 [Brassica carinata]
MWNQVGNKLTRLVVFPNGKYLNVCLLATNFKILPCGWRRHTKLRLTFVDQLSEKLSEHKEKQGWLDRKSILICVPEMLTKLHDKKSGFLVNDELKIVAEVDVLKVIGRLDVSEEESQEVTQPLKRAKLSDGAVSIHLNKETSSVEECVDVNGFQPSQVQSVKRLFERHPDMALEFRAKSQHLRTSCMNVLLNLIETLCQSLKDLSLDDLSQAEKALTYLKCSGFKVDLLERRLEELEEMKNKEEELEEELKGSKEKCSDIEALLEKKKEELKDLKQKCSDIENEKAKVLAARALPQMLFD